MESKSTTEVPVLTEAGAEPVMLAFDRRICLEYLVQPRSMVTEKQRNALIQTTSFINTMYYGFYLSPEANNCRYRVVFA